MRAHLRYYIKNKVHDRHVVELSIYEVGKWSKLGQLVKTNLTFGCGIKVRRSS